VSVVEFVLLVLVDVPVTLFLVRHLLSETSGVFRVSLAYLHGILMGGFYTLLLKDDKGFFVEIDYGSNFYRDLVVVHGGVVIMVLFHAWSISRRRRR
jgi:hypothetical protein